MAIEFVQSITEGSNANTITPATATTAGNLLVLVGRLYGAEEWPVLTDTGSNTWVEPIGVSTSPPPAALVPGNFPAWLAYVNDANSVTSVTDATSVSSMTLGEFSGVYGIGAADSASSDATSEPTVSVAYNDGDLIVGFVYADGSPTVPTGWTDMENGADSNTCACYQVMSGSGTATLTWSPSISGGWAAVAQVFTAPPPAPVGDPMTTSAAIQTKVYAGLEFAATLECQVGTPYFGPNSTQGFWR